jgi:MFS family permease
MTSVSDAESYRSGTSGPMDMWIVAAQLAVLYTGSTLPTPLYVIYSRALHFSQVTLTFIYAAYVVGTLTVLFLFGRLSDQIGRRIVSQMAIAAAAASTIVFVLARSLAIVYTGRILSGFSIALAAGASTAWITELEPRHDRRRATSVAVGANRIGLGVGPLASGLLAQFAPAPLRLPFILFFVLLLPTWVVIRAPRETVGRSKPIREVSFRPRLGVPRELWPEFWPPAVTAFVLFALLGFYSALIPTVLSQQLHEQSHAVAGGVVGGLFLVGGAVAFALAEMTGGTAMLAGLFTLLPSVVVLVLAQRSASMTLLLVSSALAGVSAAFGYCGTLQTVNDLAPADHRAEIVSTYLLACYAGIALPVIGIGLLARAASLDAAILAFAAMIVLLALAALVGRLRHSVASAVRA